ncbi:hypothetical protein PPERSA_00510 [Pseudocohnilembus persalinus]|uniref:Uncharacterized protein n=1 Tax=Pseudocohnilembus persalinus TaxID=266149 RepID=A0A0V0QI95_PSEPJ|nr:hypothetical protein PPERSA_00510 [Pseudocohnilembus persalinus]|eukprot:KRX01800.1 hypothetical protein PPERSA_00510 [Pseudocohnilembus persalinus]
MLEGDNIEELDSSDDEYNNEIKKYQKAKQELQKQEQKLQQLREDKKKKKIQKKLLDDPFYFEKSEQDSDKPEQHTEHQIEILTSYYLKNGKKIDIKKVMIVNQKDKKFKIQEKIFDEQNKVISDKTYNGEDEITQFTNSTLDDDIVGEKPESKPELKE